MPARVLIVGYGNPDRQDDGIAWHVLCALAETLGQAQPPQFESEFAPESDPQLLFCLQLTPELSETLSQVERVCFVDAHAGDLPHPVHLVPLECEYQPSPFTHHLTPQSLLAICQAAYQKTPDGVLFSIKAYSFEFERSLSPSAASLVPLAVKTLSDWLGVP